MQSENNDSTFFGGLSLGDIYKFQNDFYTGGEIGIQLSTVTKDNTTKILHYPYKRYNSLGDGIKAKTRNTTINTTNNQTNSTIIQCKYTT